GNLATHPASSTQQRLLLFFRSVLSSCYCFPRSGYAGCRCRRPRTSFRPFRGRLLYACDGNCSTLCTHHGAQPAAASLLANAPPSGRSVNTPVCVCRLVSWSTGPGLWQCLCSPRTDREMVGSRRVSKFADEYRLVAERLTGLGA